MLMSPLPPCVERLNIFIRKTDSEPLGCWLGGSQSPDASDVGDCVFPQRHCPPPGRHPHGSPAICPGLHGVVWGLSNHPACLGVCTAQNCEERNLKESGYQCEWRYNSCAPACPVTCQHPEPLACPVQCVEGCHAHCPPGEALAPCGDGVEGGAGPQESAAPSCFVSASPKGPSVPSPITLCPVSMSFHQSQAS